MGHHQAAHHRLESTDDGELREVAGQKGEPGIGTDERSVRHQLGHLEPEADWRPLAKQPREPRRLTSAEQGLNAVRPAAEPRQLGQRGAKARVFEIFPQCASELGGQGAGMGGQTFDGGQGRQQGGHR